MNKNIWLSYLLVFLKNSWFWLGIWVFYYLRFTNYAGIGVIESVLIITMTVTEIPTGAIADLFGKKKTLFLSFLLQGISNIGMGITPNFTFLAMSVFIASIGASLYSGTLEALVYDTLKQKRKEAEYDKKIANINMIQLIAPAICGVLGGFMYTVNPGLPFIASGVFLLIGCLLTLFLTEPVIDTIKFSFQNYKLQIKEGIKELTKTINIRNQTILFLSVGFIVVIFDEMLNGFLSLEFGINEKITGTVWAIIYIVSALASQAIPFFKKYLNEKTALIFTGGIIALSLIVSPLLGLVLGGISLIVRSSFQSVYTGLTSIMINNHTESKYRATTLSTFNMIKNIPYVLSAFFIGSLADKYSAKNIAFGLGILLIFFLTFQMIKIKKGSAVSIK